MITNRYEKIVATMVADKTNTNSKRFRVSVNGVEHFLNLIEINKSGDYVFQSEKDSTIHKFMHVPPFHRKYHTNGNTEYIFKEEY
jgi:septin family protein